MYFNMNEWSQEIINARDRRFLPVYYFPCVNPLGMKVVDTLKDCDGMPMAKVMKHVLDRHPSIIAAMTPMDLSVDSEAFGCKVKFSENDSPAIIEHVKITTIEEANALQIPDPFACRLGMQYDAVAKASEMITDKPIFGGQLGPYSLAAKIINISDAMTMSIKNPEIMHVLLEKATKHLINRALEFKKAGANGVLLAEPTAGLLSPKMSKVFSSDYVKQIVDAVQDEGFFVILHDCGRVTKMSKDMYETGCKGFHFGNIVDMAEICRSYPEDVLVMGNLDPSKVATLSSDEIRSLSDELLEATKEFPHFVFSTGCDLPVSTPLENIDAMTESLAAFNANNK